MRSKIQWLFTITAPLLALLGTLLLKETTYAQGHQYAAGSNSGPPSVMFVVIIACVFVGIIVLFLVFARSQGCDTSKDKEKTWNEQ